MHNSTLCHTSKPHMTMHAQRQAYKLYRSAVNTKRVHNTHDHCPQHACNPAQLHSNAKARCCVCLVYKQPVCNKPRRSIKRRQATTQQHSLPTHCCMLLQRLLLARIRAQQPLPTQPAPGMALSSMCSTLQSCCSCTAQQHCCQQQQITHH